MKPFCSGDRADARLLRSLQGNELTLDEINPFYFRQPVAPWVAARNHSRAIALSEALKPIRRIQARCDWLLVEGIGGVLVPLGEDFSVLDLIGSMAGDVLVVARNRVGVINHTLLTIRALKTAVCANRRTQVILMGTRKPDVSSRTNAEVLSSLLPRVPIFCIPFLGTQCRSAQSVRTVSHQIQETLSRILDHPLGAHQAV